MSRPRQHFFLQLLGTRRGWPENMDERERRVMHEHFVYLRSLTWAGHCLLAGPVFPADQEPAFGLIVLECADEEEAHALAAADPSVREGVHSYALRPMSASLLHGRQRFAPRPGERVIEKTVEVPASRDAAWTAWSTADGLRGFFAPNVNMELRPGGPFEIRFSDEAPPGEGGSEGCTVQAWLPGEMLAFSWNAPPAFPRVRQLRTQVVLLFAALGEERCRVRLINHGYGQGEEWDAAFDYFDRAWGTVMEGFAKTFSV